MKLRTSEISVKSPKEGMFRSIGGLAQNEESPGKT